MNAQGLIALACTATTLLIALYIIWRYPRLRLHRAFAFQIIGFSAYTAFLVGLAQAETRAAASDWMRYGMVLPYLLIFSFYHFARVFSRFDRKPWVLWLPRVMALPAAADVVGRLLGWYHLASMEFRVGQGWFPGPELPYYYLLLPTALIMLGSALGLMLWRWVKTDSPLERQSLMICWLSAALALLLCLTALLRKASFLMPLGPLAYVGITAYGLSRRRLLDMTLILRQGALAALSSLMLTFTVALAILGGFKIFNVSPGMGALFTAAILFALVYPIQHRAIRHLLGRWLGQQFNLRQKLLEYSLLSNTHRSFEGLMEATLERLMAEHGLASACLYLTQRGSALGVFAARPKDGPYPPLDPAGPLGRLLLANPQGLERDSLGWTRMYERDPPKDEGEEAARAFLEEAGFQACFPLVVRGALRGVLAVGPPKSGRALAGHEAEFLAALASQLAGMVETNALEGQVQHAERLSTLGLLAASLAHDIRNPLTSISVYVQMLPGRAKDPEYIKKFGQVMNQEILKLTQMCDDMSALSRPANLAVGVVDLAQLCDRERALVAQPFRKRQVQLEIQCPQGLMVKGDETRLSQVLLNLLLNALEVSPEGAAVRVDVLRGTRWAEMRVRDHGTGISSEAMPRLFEPFFTTKETGHGLGLATCRRVVESLGGSIEAANAPGGGAEFIVRLPWAESGPQRATA